MDKDIWSLLMDINTIEREMRYKTLAQQIAKVHAYLRLTDLKLPIPPDLKAAADDIESLAYASGYICGWKGDKKWCPAWFWSNPIWEMGYADGEGDHELAS